MKIVILDGKTGGHGVYGEHLRLLTRLLETRGHEVISYDLGGMRIHDCVGCYACWTRTPGLCVFNDDMTGVLNDYARADFALFVSPVVMGFVTAALKRVNERLLPLTHPYFQFLGDRFQHILRYDKLPANGLLLSADGPSDREFIPVIDDIFRSAVNRRHLFTRLINEDMEAIADEIDRI